MRMIWMILFALLSVVSHAQEIPEFFVEEAPYTKLFHRTVLNGTPVEKKSDILRFIAHLSIQERPKNGLGEGKPRGNCTGFVISENIIMTAGHCLVGKDAQVVIRFGRDPNRSITKIISREYRSSDENKAYTPGASDWVNGFLEFDRNEHAKFLQERQTRVDLKKQTVDQVNAYLKQDFLFDIAVIKVDRLPKDIHPVRFYKGALPPFKTPLLSVGYGTNSRYSNQLDKKLRQAPQELLGIAEKEGQLAAFEYYGQNGSEKVTCKGDSGSPVLVQVDAEYQVFALHTNGANTCADAKWGILPAYFQDTVNEWIRDLLRTNEA